MKKKLFAIKKLSVINYKKIEGFLKLSINFDKCS